MKNQAVVYKITCKENGKFYIGVTHQQLTKRFSQHKTRPPIKMNKDIKEYSWSAFKIEQIYKDTEYNCYEKEKELINNLIPEYNSNAGGFGGIGMKGESNWCSILTEKNVIDIRNMWATGKYTQKYLANKFKVNNSHICRIVTGEKWKDVGGTISPVKTIKINYSKHKAKLTESDVINIRNIAKNKELKQVEIAKKYNTLPNNISRIVNGKRWKDVGGPIKGIDY